MTSFAEESGYVFTRNPIRALIIVVFFCEFPVIVPGAMWQLTYRTVPDEQESISFGIGAFWDGY
jgi:hypothetical protein